MADLTWEQINKFTEKRAELREKVLVESGMSYSMFLEAGRWYYDTGGVSDTFKLNGIPKFCVWVDTAARGSTTICWIEYEENQ